MEIGDVVEYQETRWRVYKRDHHVRTVTLLRADDHLEEVEDDHSGLKKLFTPGKWPFVTAPLHPTAGKVTKLYRPRGIALNELAPLHDWVVSDPARPGGAIFMNPRLRLRQGETLIVEYARGKRARVIVSPNFGSMALRRKRNEKPPPDEAPKLGDSLDELAADFMADD